MTAGGTGGSADTVADGSERRLTGYRHGDGPGVLWLHGYTMDSLVWSQLWRRLPGWCHVGVDLPGHGRSRRLGTGETLAGLADEVAQWVDGLGIRHVVGMSLGGMLALELALRHPGLARSWVLASPSVAGGPTDPDVEGCYRDLGRVYARRGPGPHLSELWLRAPTGIFDGLRDRPAVARLVTGRIVRHGWDELEHWAMRSLTAQAQDLGGLAGAAGPAVLVVVGDRDRTLYRDAAEMIAERGGGPAPHVVPGAGHLAPIEEPDAVAPALLRHWERTA